MIYKRLRSTGLASLLGPSNPINADLYTFLPVVNTDIFFSRFACLRANVLDPIPCTQSLKEGLVLPTTSGFENEDDK